MPLCTRVLSFVDFSFIAHALHILCGDAYVHTYVRTIGHIVTILMYIQTYSHMSLVDAVCSLSVETQEGHV